MSIFHTLERKLRSCRRQQDAVVAYMRKFSAPPILAKTVDYPFCCLVPIVQLRVRLDESRPSVSDGWRYRHWHHFIAHVLVAGWPEFRRLNAGGRP